MHEVELLTYFQSTRVQRNVRGVMVCNRCAGCNRMEIRRKLVQISRRRGCLI